MKIGSPKVSVGVVTYNHENFIEACLDSIRQQTYPNIEVVVSDDCSTDRTREILKAYQEKHPHFITRLLLPIENMGIEKNVNHALSNTDGEYLFAFAGDDIMSPQKIQKQVEAMEASPEVGICYTNMEWYDPISQKTWFRHFGLLQKPPRNFADLIRENTLPSPTYLLKRSCLPNYIYDESMPLVSDYKMALDVMENYENLYVNDVLVRYCKHKESATATHFFPKERMRLHIYLKNKFGTKYPKEIAYNRAVCRYAYIMQNLKNGKTKRGLLLTKKLFPHCLTSVKWLSRLILILRLVIKNTIASRRP